MLRSPLQRLGPLPMDGDPSKRRLLAAIVAGDTGSLERCIWEITVAELQSGSCCYRKALVEALDGSAFLAATQRAELLQQLFTLSQRGSAEAKCFVGILLCFHSQREEELALAKEGARFLLSGYHQQCDLATLLLALCYECGRGVERSVDSALQCYNVAATHGYQLAQIFWKECAREFGSEPPRVQQPPPPAQVRLSGHTQSGTRLILRSGAVTQSRAYCLTGSRPHLSNVVP